jgi:HAD superfamily hydrolase (TIGR01458 family)
VGAVLNPPLGYLLDLDGTLYSGNAAIPGARDALRRLREQQLPVRLVTNTTSRSRALLVERLRGYGFEVESGEVFTATVAGSLLARKAGYRCVAPFVPEAALEDLTELDLVGGTSNHPVTDRRPQVVVIGDLAQRWNYDLLQEAFEYIMEGADLIALSRDRYWLNHGQLALDAGPFVAALEFATGKPATVAGKPSALFFAAALESLGGMPPGLVAMIGDDLWSDVAGAQHAGLQGWLVRTGKYRAGALEESGIRPDRLLDSVAELG